MQIKYTIAVYFIFSGLLDRLKHHDVFHRRVITFLLSALAIAGNKVVSKTFTIIIVLNSCKIEVFSSLFDELTQHDIVRMLNYFVLVVRWA